MKIAFLIASLHTGGAQRQLSSLAAGLASRGHAVRVFAMRSGGVFRRELEREGIAVVLPGAAQAPWRFFPRLVGELRRFAPDIVHSYLPTANVLSALLRPWLAPAKIVWGLRMTRTETRRYPLFHRLVFGLERRSPLRGDLVIANAAAVLDEALASGMPERKLRLIPNGFDENRFRFSAKGRARWRERWGLGDGDRAVGLIGRIDPMKGHEIFLAAVHRLAAEDPTLHAVLVGSGTPSRRAALERQIQDLGLRERVRWQAPSRSAAEIYSALDLVCSASIFGEGFSNVLAEAALCGVPCIATAVGDVSRIVEEPDLIVPPNDVAALATAIDRRLEIGPLAADGARRRISTRFSLESLIDRTEAALAALTARA